MCLIYTYFKHLTPNFILAHMRYYLDSWLLCYIIYIRVVRSDEYNFLNIVYLAGSA